MRSGKTRTTSFSLAPDTLRDLKALARRRHGGNVSALLSEIAGREARFVAAELFFDKYGVAPLDEAQLKGIAREWRAAGPVKKVRPEGSLSFTFDTGMLIALERRKQRALLAFRAITQRGYLPVVPAVVCAEWWRGRTDIREEILAAVLLEDMSLKLCRATGEALAAVRGTSLADAAVMASAALRGGGVVYTSDPGDLGRLQAHFPAVRVLAV